MSVLTSSSTISSSLSAQNDLLMELARLRNQLSQAESSLEQAKEQGFRISTVQQRRRLARSDPTKSTYASTSPSLPPTGLGIAVTNSSRSRTASAPGSPASPRRASSTVTSPILDERQSPSIKQGHARKRSSSSNPASPTVGYPGLPPSSLATTSPTVYSLKRDDGYEDLQSVMESSPTSPSSLTKTRSFSAGIRKQRSSDGTALKNSNGSTSRLPMPVIAKGRVGTAATLAGGGSPQREVSDANGHPSVDGVSPTTESAVQDPREDTRANHVNSNGYDDLTLRAPSQSLPFPSNEHIPRSVSPSMRFTKSSDHDNRDGPKSAGLRANSSPFFGSSAGFTERHAARIASSQSNTSKVITNLQTELTNSRAQLESTRTQLRSSARAVESMTRQVEDIKETKERLRLELQNASTTITRKERMLEETVTRARQAESLVRQLEEQKRAHTTECVKRTKELEARVKEAEERRAKAESEYAAIKAGSAALSEGIKREMKLLRKEHNALRLLSEKQANEARSRQSFVTKAVGEKLTIKEDVETALEELKAWQTQMQQQYQHTLNQLDKHYEASSVTNTAMQKRAEDVADDLAKFRSAVRRFGQQAAPGP